MKSKPPWFDQADAALQRAAKRAREVAARTNTPLVVQRDGKIVKLWPVARELALREEPPACGTKPD